MKKKKKRRAFQFPSPFFIPVYCWWYFDFNYIVIKHISSHYTTLHYIAFYITIRYNINCSNQTIAPNKNKNWRFYLLYDMMRDRIYCWYSNNQNFLLNYASGICFLSFSFFFFLIWLLKTIDNNDILVINVNDPRMQVIHNFIIIEDKTRQDMILLLL